MNEPPTTATSSQPPLLPAGRAGVGWRSVPRDAWKADWSMTNRRAGLVCMPVVAAWVFYGIIVNQKEWAVLAVAGAVAVGFGAFQRLGKRRLRPMLVTLIGIAIATWVGSVAVHMGWVPIVILAAICGFGFGAMTMLGYGAWWIGLQWMIGLIVYGAHPASASGALRNAAGVLAGGISQLVFISLLRPWTDQWFRRQAQPPLDVREHLLRALARNMNPSTVAGKYAIRVAIALALGAMVNHLWQLPNGYWTPMTVAILLKPELRETSVRGLNRLAGTLAGAGLTTLVVALAQPNNVTLGLLLLFAVWGCYALQRVNYGLFATCITAYVVLLLSVLALPEKEVALRRVEATLVGAAIALAVHLMPMPARKLEGK